MGQCKICETNQDRREEVERLLKTGRPFKEISKDLEKLGFKVASTQLMTHFTKHMDEGKGKFIEQGNDEISIIDETIDFEKRLKELEQDLLSINYRDKALKGHLKAAILLEKISLLQMIIVETELKRYCSGIGNYPSEQVRGMKTTLDLLSNLPSYADKTLLYEVNRISSKH